MPYSPQAAPRLFTSEFPQPQVRATLSAAFASARPLLPAAALSLLSYCALAVLMFSPALRTFDAGTLPESESLRAVAALFGGDTLLNYSDDPAVTFAAVLLYLVIAGAALASWWWAMRIAPGLTLGSPLPLIALTAVIAAPLLIAPALTSDDLYLYNMYGRTISVYGANPLLLAPSDFPSDPHLEWVHWADLPSAYGPIWLMVAGLLSGLAGDSMTAVAVLYRLTALALHLATVAVLWRVLRNWRPSAAAPATMFYAWNPLVLLEVVGNAHNDVLVALFAVPLIAAAVQQRWRRAAVWAACAVMVKPFAVVLVPAVARQLWLQTEGRERYRQLALCALVGTAVALALQLPLWSGDALIRNALHNPAASSYTNSLWELVANRPHWLGMSVPDEGTPPPYLALIRALAFFGGAGWVLTRRATMRDVPEAGVGLWLVFCLTACWLWPWYFVPVLALIPLAGAAALSTGIALTIGGVLFWAAWPDRGVGVLPQLHEWRSLLLFGPLILLWCVAPARALATLAVGLRTRMRGSDRFGTEERWQVGSYVTGTHAVGAEPSTHAGALRSAASCSSVSPGMQT